MTALQQKAEVHLTEQLISPYGHELTWTTASIGEIECRKMIRNGQVISPVIAYTYLCVTRRYFFARLFI